MTVTTEAEALVPGPGGFATPVPVPSAHATSAQATQATLAQATLTETLADPSGAVSGEAFPVPRLSAGLQLHGEYQGSGFTEPRYIARRRDGQVVQLSRLLHLVARAIDGVRDTEGISHRVSGLFGREISAENVLFLIDNKLIPLGVAVPWGQEHDEVDDAPRSDLLLALKGHKVLFTPRRVNRIGRALAWLHRPPVVALVLLAALAQDIWLFALHGAMTPLLQVLDQPVLLLAVFALTVASLMFHEFGHASACRYGGARPGCIGCGLFLIWPSLYTDVTDVYRIGRGGRIRTDLGGVYFNVVFMLALTAGYVVTGQPFLLCAVYLGHFEILEQLMPAVRLDGYYILGDLAGIPDLYGKIRPILAGMIPGRPVPPEVAGLKRSARTIVTCWVVTMVPLLAADLGYALWNLPRILSTSVRSLTEQLAGTGDALTHHQFATGAVGLLGCLMLICPLAGTTYLSVRLAGRLFRSARRATADNPGLRVSLCALTTLTVAGLTTAWVVGMTPRPIPAQPPIIPVLQPGVPTTVATPAPTTPAPQEPGSTGSGSGTGGRSRHGPGSNPIALPSVSASASASASPSASATATTTAVPSATPSPRPTASPSASASPTRPVVGPTTKPTGVTSASPSASASATPPPATTTPSASATAGGALKPTP